MANPLADIADAAVARLPEHTAMAVEGTTVSNTHVVAEVPLTSVGKTDRKAARDLSAVRASAQPEASATGPERT